MATILALMQPLDPVTGERALLRVSNTADPAAAGWNGERWWPAMLAAPKLSVTLFGSDFDGKASAGAERLSLAMDVVRAADPASGRYVWARAPITLYRFSGENAEEVFKGRVTDFSADTSGALALNLAVDDEPFQVSVLASAYAGNGGAEGAPDLKGRPKPWLFGRAVGIEPVLINAVDSVYQVSAYGPVSAITGCFERGASFGPPAGDHADYAALVAAPLQPGQWATCLAQGMIRLGAPASGLITVDADGDAAAGFVRMTGEILGRIAAARGASAHLAPGSLAALDAAVPQNISLYLTEQVTLLDLAQRLAAPCNAAAGVNLLGEMFVCRIVVGAPSITLDALARQWPPVVFFGEEPVHAPYSRIVLGASRTWRVHGFDEIAFTAPFFERGIYDAATIYYEGNIVTRGDGSRWLYVAATGQAGVTPGTDPEVWFELSGAAEVSWDNVSDPAGTKPEDNATVGAPVGTPVAGRPAEQLVQDVDAASDAIGAIAWRTLVLESETIPAIDAAIAAAGDRIDDANALIAGAETRITAARNRADAAFVEIGEEAARIDQRIDNLVVDSGGDGNDGFARAEIVRVEQAAVAADTALASRTSLIEASYSIDSGLTPNGTFEKSALGWVLTGAAEWLEAPGDAFGVIRATGAPGTAVGPRIAVQPGKSYRLRARFASRGIGMRHYAGFQCFDLAGNSLGNLYIAEVWGQPFPHAWINAVGTVTGEQDYGPAPVYVSGTAFPVGTRSVEPLFLLNYDLTGATGSLICDLDHLYIEDASDLVAAKARIADTEDALADGLFAAAQRSSAIEASVDDAEARILATETAVSDGRFATAQRASQIEAAIDAAESRIADTETAVSDGRFATAQRAQNIETAVGGIENDLDLAAARISTVEVATSDGRFAAAERVDEIEAEFNGTSATVSQHVGAIAGLNTRTAAYLRTVAVAGNNRAQLTLHADANGGAGVDIVGDVSIAGDLLVSGSVTTGELAENAVTAGALTFAAGSIGVGGANAVQVAQCGIAATGGNVRIDFNAAFSGYAGAGPGSNVSYIIKRNGTVIRTGTFVRAPGGYQASVNGYQPELGNGYVDIVPEMAGSYHAVFVDLAPPAGNHSYSVELDGQLASGSVESRTLALLELKR